MAVAVVTALSKRAIERAARAKNGWGREGRGGYVKNR